jgi:replicative DNA helicase
MGNVRLEDTYGTTDQEWDEPTPLSVRPPLPAFPVATFPDWLAAEIAAVAEFTQTPPDLPGTISLAVLATAAGGRAVVEVRGSWREPVNLFTAVAMPPGARKSPVFTMLTSPLLRAEQQLITETRPKVIEAKTQRDVASKAAEQAVAAAGKAKANEAAALLDRAVNAAAMAEEISVPTLPRLIADDLTTEAAASLLAEQGGRLAVLSAEGGIFSTLAGRYSGGVPSFEVFLKGHAGDLLRVDRKGRPPEHVERPALSLGLVLQPEVLRQIAHMPGFRGRGLLARILFSLPTNNVGRRKVGAPPIPKDVQETYDANVKALVSSLHEWTDPAVLVLTPDAAKLLLDFEADLEPRLHPDTGDLGHVADWASKLVGATVRIAGLLHLAGDLREGWGRPISADTAICAIQLADYFTTHALAVFDWMGLDRRWMTRVQCSTGSSGPGRSRSAGAARSPLCRVRGSRRSPISSRRSSCWRSTATSACFPRSRAPGRVAALRPPTLSTPL